MTQLTSYFAEPDREKPEKIKIQKSIIEQHEYLNKLYDAVAEIILILNNKRQIVFYNENLIKALGLGGGDFSLYGLRPGEALDCIHSYKTEAGCGTSEFCRTCGAVQAIINSQNGNPDIKECKITQKKTGDAVDMLVKATPAKFNDQDFTIFSMKDISDEKRRKVLERIFFHDILNTAGGVRALAELIKDANQEELVLFRNMINSSAEKLIEEIQSQRDLTAAENNELCINLELMDTKSFLEGMSKLYKMHPAAENKNLEIDNSSHEVQLQTDKTILSRIIGNLIKNALEACSEGETVTYGNIFKDNKVTFWVHNPSYISRNIQLQLFRRSFSTKGNNRGIGTYSIKLFTERYLKGEVSFTSTENEGTVFKVILPLLYE